LEKVFSNWHTPTDKSAGDLRCTGHSRSVKEQIGDELKPTEIQSRRASVICCHDHRSTIL